MNIDGTAYRTIFLAEDQWRVVIIDQTRLPHEFHLLHLETLEQTATAIKEMQVRGAPLIGATAAYGLALAMRTDASDEMLQQAYYVLVNTRPTAVNLCWALDLMYTKLSVLPRDQRESAAYVLAAQICDDDVAMCSAIGDHGFALIRECWQQKNILQKHQLINTKKTENKTIKNKQAAEENRVNILTHCNAGWLATVDWGTALSPIYKAHDAGIPVHVWVDETRPRNQGFNLTAWELAKHGVPHTVIADNVGGHLMQHGQVDLCIVGTDRTTRTGDVCNKIGTYLKALAAYDNQVPFYVALPSPTIDWTIKDGVKEIPIEERDPSEVTSITGQGVDGCLQTVHLTPQASVAANYGFDVTPVRLVTGLITERGICAANEKSLCDMFADKQ